MLREEKMKRLWRRKVGSKQYTAYRSGRASLSPPIESIGAALYCLRVFPVYWLSSYSQDAGQLVRRL